MILALARLTKAKTTVKLFERVSQDTPSLHQVPQVHSTRVMHVNSSGLSKVFTIIKLFQILIILTSVFV